jgi:type IV pilus assembly protein PilY1
MSMRNIGYTIAAAALTAASGLGIAPAQADDTEVFFSVSDDTGGKANVLFIIDTSQSMFSVEEENEKPYDPGTDYLGACDNDKYYWTASGGSTPDCSAGWAALTADEFNCVNWRDEVDAATGPVSKTSRMAQKNPATAAWVTITANPPGQSAWKMACETSASDEAPANWKLKNRGQDVYPSDAYTFYKGNWLNWIASGAGGSKFRIDIMREAVARVIANTDNIKVGLMRFGYDGDREFKQDTATACEVLPDADEATKSSNGAPVLFPITDPLGAPVPDMNGGTALGQILYQLGVGADGENLGWIVDPREDPADQPFQIAVGGGSTCPIPVMTPGGRSPIGGAMMEAFLYYSGQDWSLKYGKQAALGSTFGYPSVEQSRVDGGDQYKSPVVESCAKNFIVLLSDGTTEQDNDVDGPIQSLPGFERVTGSKQCDKEAYLTETPPPSMCVDDMAEYMYETDMSSTVKGLQNVITHTVGFKLGADDAANDARKLLDETASRGGGTFYEAGSAQELADVMGDIIREILTENTSFSSPAVTVNAFNRTQNLNDLYMSLFRPSFDSRWLGNIKKYRLQQDGDIVDKNGDPAVDPGTGSFRDSSWSYWTDGARDGDDVTRGGAAGEIDYTTRKLYTNLTGTSNVPLADDGNSLSNLEDDAYDLTAADTLGIKAGDTISVADLVLWAKGKDVADATGPLGTPDGVTDQSRKDMGDPLHGKPLTVIYGGSVADPDLDDAVIFAVTNDGFLHAIDPIDGTELWSFIPSNLLGRLRDLYYNKELADPTIDREYGIDGNIRLLRIDNNRNGVIEPANEDGKRDKVYIFFGQRRGGSYYYGLDVTSKTAPKLMWMQSYAASYGAGQSWSTPTPAKVRIGNVVKNVLIFGAGYDPGQDQVPYRQDQYGRGIYMVDALTGDMLWRAGPPASDANLILTGMEYSIPGDIRVIDLTGDGFADRMYAADLGGQVWRFDIINGQPAGTDGTEEGQRLVEGGMLASLGNAPSGDGAASNALRFFYAPDPAIVQANGSTFINVAIGSGHRENPITDKLSDNGVQNWFFSIRDYLPFGVLKESEYQTSDCSGSPCHETVTEDDLIDLTDDVDCDDPDTPLVEPCVAAGAAGWKFELEEDGEKALAESRTFPVVNAFTGAVTTSVLFSTYSPVETGKTEDGCGTKFGINKLYAVSATDARPVNNFDQEAGESTADRGKELESRGTIAPEVVLVFPSPDDPSNPGAIPPVCLVGLESCGTSIANPPVRTFWKHRGAN